MRQLLFLLSLVISISCSPKTTIEQTNLVEDNIPDIDLSNYTMLCFSKKYISQNNINLSGIGKIHNNDSDNRICVYKKDYLTHSIVKKAFYGDKKAIDQLILVHKSLYRHDHINYPSYYKRLRGQKIFDYYYKRFQTSPCRETSSDCTSNYIAALDYNYLLEMIDNIKGQDPKVYMKNNTRVNIGLKSEIEYCNDTYYQLHMAVLTALNEAIENNWITLKEFGQE